MLPLFLLVTQCLQKTEAASISGEKIIFLNKKIELTITNLFLCNLKKDSIAALI